MKRSLLLWIPIQHASQHSLVLCAKKRRFIRILFVTHNRRALTGGFLPGHSGRSRLWNRGKERAIKLGALCCYVDLATLHSSKRATYGTDVPADVVEHTDIAEKLEATEVRPRDIG
jgi:hypothetical protein